MNILITDYYCASNRGDAAILEGVYQRLKEVYPRAEIKVMTENPEAAKLVHGFDVVEQKLAGFRWSLSKKNAVRAYLSLSSPLYNRGVTPAGFDYINDRTDIQPYLDADLVISTGGQFLTDIYFPEKIGVLWEHYFLSQLNKPVILYAQTLGPFNRSFYRMMTRRALDRTDLIITRDEKSKEVVNNLGISTPIHCTADAAFSMDPENVRGTPLDNLQANDDLPDKNEKTVSISVREWKYFNESSAEKGYTAVLADVADWLVSEKGMNVVFASTCTGLAGYHKDDRLFAAHVVDLMDHGEREEVQILTGEYTPQQLVQIYEQMDLHIGMRMHSNILAMMAHTPVVAIQYQFKTEGLMKMFDMTKYLVDGEEVNSKNLIQIVGSAIENMTDIEEKIKLNLPKISKRSKKSAEIIRHHIDIR